MNVAPDAGQFHCALMAAARRHQGAQVDRADYRPGVGRPPDPRLAVAPGPIHPDRVLSIQLALPTPMVSIAAVLDLRPSRHLGDAAFGRPAAIPGPANDLGGRCVETRCSGPA